MGKSTPFQSAHALQVGVEVKSKDAKESVSCWCLFCVHMGRDEVEVGQNRHKRKRTGNIKMFIAPLYQPKYRIFIVSPHRLVGALVEHRQGMSNTDKALNFASEISPTNTKCIVIWRSNATRRRTT